MSVNSRRLLTASLVLAGVGFAYLLGVVTSGRVAFIRTAAARVRDAILTPASSEPSAPEPSTRSLSTVFLRLNLEELEVPLSRPGSGGSLTTVGDEMLLLAYDGSIVAVSGTSTRKTRITTPDNGYHAYVAAAATEKYAGLQHNFEWVRYIDILYYHEDDEAGLVISYTEWRDEAECYGTTVARRELPPEARTIAAIEAIPGDWEVIYRTQPCLPLKEIARAIDGHIGGSRMLYYGPGKILLSVGDYHWDGIFAPVAYAQAADADYGKLLEIDLDSRAARFFSIGNRNVQGIMRDDAGRIWATEHGPRGGDELNLIAEGGNYGWPAATLGTRYNGLPWPVDPAHERHAGFTLPVYAWVPSVGISHLMQIRDFDPSWDGDFLVASLAGGTLYRLRLEADRIVYAEPIPIGQRIRYVHPHPDGRIVLWTDSQRLIFISKSEAPSGASVVSEVIDQMSLEPERESRLNSAIEVCAQCHSFDTEAGGYSGPPLGLVFEGAIAGGNYNSYSAALRSRGGAWTRESLVRFLENPGAFAPGTTMPAPNLPRETLDDVINVLRDIR